MVGRHPIPPQHTNNNDNRYEDGGAGDGELEQASLQLLEEPLLRPGETKWRIHARVTALSKEHGQKRFALSIDVSQFDQREHGLCCAGVLTPPFRVNMNPFKGGGRGSSKAGAGVAGAVAAPAPVAVVVEATRESSRRREKEERKAAAAAAAVAVEMKGKGGKGGKGKGGGSSSRR